jgi:hypothetical protein
MSMKSNSIENRNLQPSSMLHSASTTSVTTCPNAHLFSFQIGTTDSSPGIKQAKHEDAHFNLEPRFLTCGILPHLPHLHSVMVKHSSNELMVTAVIKIP